MKPDGLQLLFARTQLNIKDEELLNRDPLTGLELMGMRNFKEALKKPDRGTP